MRIASFVYNPAAAISEMRTLTHTHKNLLMLRSVTAKGYHIATYDHISKKINSFASYTSDCNGGVFLLLYNSKFDLITKIIDFFIIKSFTNIKIRVIINSQAKRKEVRTKWTKQNLNR